MKGRAIVITIPLVIVLMVIAILAFFTRVPVATIGVRQARWGGGGVQRQDHGPGIRLRVAGYHLWHFLPSRTHFLHFTTRRSRHIPDGEEAIEDWQPPVEIRTRDKNTLIVDITIPYRIREGEGHQIVAEGYQNVYRRRVKATVQDVLRSELSNLTSEELQITDKRLERARAALPILNEKLGNYYVEADHILIRRIQFPAEYEEKLQEKQYLRQKALLDQARARQNNMEQRVFGKERSIDAEVLKKEREWEKRFQEAQSKYQVIIAQIRADAQVYSERVRAEGERESTEAIADGQLAVEKARALRDELRNKALSSRGGRIKLALEAVNNLNIASVTLNSDDPAVPMLLDLNQMTKLLVGAEGSPEADALGKRD